MIVFQLDEMKYEEFLPYHGEIFMLYENGQKIVKLDRHNKIHQEYFKQQLRFAPDCFWETSIMLPENDHIATDNIDGCYSMHVLVNAGSAETNDPDVIYYCVGLIPYKSNVPRLLLAVDSV